MILTSFSISTAANDKIDNIMIPIDFETAGQICGEEFFKGFASLMPNGGKSLLLECKMFAGSYFLIFNSSTLQ